ncbi:MAG: hypothetical protein NDF56_00840 [archaeon GB-1845-036]|nr:hypothetical protein [Candidatus Culexmicrobium thermophilum]
MPSTILKLSLLYALITHLAFGAFAGISAHYILHTLMKVLNLNEITS